MDVSTTHVWPEMVCDSIAFLQSVLLTHVRKNLIAAMYVIAFHLSNSHLSPPLLSHRMYVISSHLS